jgi:hypothetical protein
LNKGRFLRENQNLKIAGIRFIVSKDPLVRLRVENSFYLPFLGSASEKENKLKIDICLRFGGFPPFDRMEKIFATGESWSLYRDEKYFWIVMAPPQHAEPFWIARFNRQASRVTIYCRSVFPAPGKKKTTIDLPIVYPLDQLLLMYFLARRQGILTHAAGVVKGGRAFIFPGASGAGKSTFSELLVKAKIGKMLSDERMIIRETDGVMQAFGTPWAGTAGIARNANAPLAGIYFLKHGPRNHIEKLSAGEALDKFLPLVSIPWYDPDTLSKIIAFAKHLVAKVPAYEMSFTPGRSAVDCFWQFQKTSF